MWVAGIVGTAMAAFVAKLGLKAGSQDRADNAKVGVMMAVQPTTERMTTDALVQTLASLAMAVNKLIDRLEEDAREQDAEEAARQAFDALELKRMVEELKRMRGPP
jgi:GAF domain-containing protein